MPQTRTLWSRHRVYGQTLIKNNFYLKIEQKQNEGATIEELSTLLGRGRAKKGMFERN